MATWYVRPDTSHSGTRNGTSYATAWGGWTEIVWGGSGVAAGDTLYVCGAHTFTAGRSVGAHGGTTTNRTTIRGDFPSDPGSITCSGSVFLTNGRANTIIRNITFTAGTSHAIFVTGAATLCDYIENTFNSTAANSVFSLYGANGENHADVLIQGNTFQCSGAGLAAGKAATIEWFMAASGGTSTLTRVKIKDNLFENCNTAGTAVSVMQLRVDNAADTACSIVDLEVDGNIFRTYKGVAIRLRDDHTGDTYDRFKGVKVRNNQFYDGGEATTPGWGGCISIGSFGQSTTVGFGWNELTGNIGYRQVGAAGGINCFFGSYYIANNYFEDFETNTIDGNAILVDLQCRDVLVHNNRWRNLRGKAGVVNSGVGIMVLNATNIRVFGNVGYDMKVGIHIGDDGTGQSAKVHNNTLWGCTDYAIYMHADADRANVSMYNNTFQGTGYSVYNNSASAWSLENYNNFDGFASGPYQHALGANDTTVSMFQFINSDGSLRMPGNPLATAGTYISGVTLANGRLRPGFAPIGAYMAVLPRTARV